MSKKFILISIVFVVLCWGVYIIGLRGIGKYKNSNEKRLINLVGFIFPFILLYFIYTFTLISCSLRTVDTKTEEVVQTFEMVSLVNAKGTEGHFSASLFGGSGYVTENIKIYFYIKEGNEYSLQDANYENCRFIYTSEKPYMEVVEQYDAVVTTYKNNKLANFLGLDFEGEYTDKKKSSKYTFYKFYIPENSINEYFNLDIPQ